jgi:hypothetical protein
VSAPSCGLLAEDCAAVHWCERLGGHRERAGWRAACPYPGCGAKRALEWGVPGRTIRWRSWCHKHDKEALRPVLRARLGDCMSQRRVDRMPVSHDDLIAVALSDMPPMSMRLALLELAGLSTTEALDKLGVRRENRSRVITGRTGGASKRIQTRRR